MSGNLNVENLQSWEFDMGQVSPSLFVVVVVVVLIVLRVSKKMACFFVLNFVFFEIWWDRRLLTSGLKRAERGELNHNNQSSARIQIWRVQTGSFLVVWHRNKHKLIVCDVVCSSSCKHRGAYRTCSARSPASRRSQCWAPRDLRASEPEPSLGMLLCFAIPLPGQFVLILLRQSLKQNK